MKNKLFIFTNEKISFKEGNFNCDNIDIKNTPEGLNKKFEINLFGRKTKKNRSHEIKISFLMAERAGFEPAKELPLYTLSKRAP